MSMSYRFTTRVDSRDVDGSGFCRPSAVLGYLQEAATAAAEELGVGREKTLGQYGAVWILARVWYRLDRPLRWGETVEIHTWHRGGKGASMYRDFDLYAGGEPVGEAVSVWALARLSDHKLLRVGDVSSLVDSDGGPLCKSIQLTRLRLPQEMETAERRLMHYSDTDLNGHVNNNRYADFACDAIHAETLPRGTYVASLQIGYTAECRAGETITMLTAAQGERRMVHGVDEAGKSRFDAVLILGQDVP